MSARYSHNARAFDRSVLTADWMRAEVKTRAERIKAQFEATAPVGEPYEDDDHAGRYKDSARVETGVEDITGHGPRVYGRVHVEDPAAMSIEFGHTAKTKDGKPGKHVEGSHTLTNALDAAGNA